MESEMCPIRGAELLAVVAARTGPNGGKLARRTTAENYIGGGRGNSTRSSSHTRGSNGIREEGRKIYNKE